MGEKFHMKAYIVPWEGLMRVRYVSLDVRP